MQKHAKNCKAQVWISAVLYLMITVVVMVIVLQAGTPLLNNMKDKSTFVRTRDTFLALNQYIKDVSDEGKGSQRVIPIEIRKGELLVKNNTLQWQMKTDARIIEPRSHIETGDLTVASNADVGVYEIGNQYILENSRIAVNFSKVGSENSWANIDTSSLIQGIKFKETEDVETGTFIFKINNDASTQTGNGYTKIDKEGINLGSAKLIAHINSTIEYELEFILDTKTDFLEVNVLII